MLDFAAKLVFQCSSFLFGSQVDNKQLNLEKELKKTAFVLVPTIMFMKTRGTIRRFHYKNCST